MGFTPSWPTRSLFSAITGQTEMKLGILIAAIDPAIGGVLILGDRGSGKSTAIRALASLLPAMAAVQGCPYGCDPGAPAALCFKCREQMGAGIDLIAKQVPVPVVDLPLGATEDRVVGALDLEQALTRGVKAFEPGLLARANRGFLYIDEVNLLEDHLVDLLLDVAQSGENVVEARRSLPPSSRAFRAGRHRQSGGGRAEAATPRPHSASPWRCGTPTKIPERVEVVRRRDAFDRDPAAFVDEWREAEAEVRRQIVAARECFASVDVPDAVLERAAGSVSDARHRWSAW